MMPARPLESLASQSQPILGSTGAPSEGHPILGSESLGGMKEKRKKGGDKKKDENENEVEDDNFDQA